MDYYWEEFLSRLGGGVLDGEHAPTDEGLRLLAEHMWGADVTVVRVACFPGKPPLIIMDPDDGYIEIQGSPDAEYRRRAALLIKPDSPRTRQHWVHEMPRKMRIRWGAYGRGSGS